MGGVDNKGIIPRLCDALFERIADKQNLELTFKVEVSYMEIYNEKVNKWIYLYRFIFVVVEKFSNVCVIMILTVDRLEIYSTQMPTNNR